MKLSRRNFMLLGASGVGLLLTGCSQNSRMAVSERPGPLWPEMADRPHASGRGSIFTPTTPPTSRWPETGSIQSLPPYDPTDRQASGPIQAIPRSRWAQASPIVGKILPMGYVDKITVHHEGWTPVFFSDMASIAGRLEAIRRSHLDRLGAGDIGYHYIIDRAGRIWQGRDLRYQGAHVRDHNPHNIGVMVMGNFDLQKPTDAQITTLRQTLATLMRQYRVANRTVFTHQELNPTECPGGALQTKMVTLRRSGIV